jgi:N6-L-threonylcarbamoyladenine synthase
VNILAFETSCDETCAAVVRDGRELLSNLVSSQAEYHAAYGGVVPEIAARAHIERIYPLCADALRAAGLTMDDIHAVAVTAAPGLIGALLVGVNFAKGLALARSLPLIPVHHLRGHIAAAYLEHPALAPPFTAAVVSGGHTQIIAADTHTRFRVLGATRDDAAGEALDKVARMLGYPYPGAAAMSADAEGGDCSAYAFPQCKGGDNPLDMSFSGLKTAAANILRRAAQTGEHIDRRDFAASFEEAVVRALASRARRAANGPIVLCGGVAANRRLRAALDGAIIPSVYLCGDNAAMIAAQAFYEYKAGNLAGFDLNASASLPVGESCLSLCKTARVI